MDQRRVRPRKGAALSIHRLARFGGRPEFQSPVPITRPTLPPYSKVAPSFRRALASGQITKGRELAEFERLASLRLSARALGVSSCTVGLVLALQALRVDGEVILPSFTFLATASAPALLKLPLRFVDVGRDTWTMDPSALAAAITPRTAAVIGVHTFGAPADVAALEEICARKHLALIFDAAHGLGTLRKGRQVGSGGDAEVFSMSPTKLVAAGEGGIVSTKRADVAERIEVLREYGNGGDYTTVQPGLNGRLNEFSAILALHGLRMLERNARRRQRLVASVQTQLANVPGITWQRIGPRDRSSYKDLTLVIEPERFGVDRDRVAAVLGEEGVDTRRFFAPLLHRHPAFSNAAVEELPNSEWLEARVLSIPIFSHMPVRTMRTIGRLIHTIHLTAAEIATATKTRNAVRVA